MTYRDDKESMGQRIEQLEGELATAHHRIARLEGRDGDHLSDAMADFDSKEELHVSRVLDVAITESGVEAIADMLRQRLPNAVVTGVGRSLNCRWGTSELRVIRHDDRTEIQLRANDPRQKLLFALGAVGFAALAGPLLAGPLAVAVPWSAVATVPLVILGGYMLMGWLVARTIRIARTTLRGAFESAVALAEAHAAKKPARIDIGADESAEQARQAEEEAAALETLAAEARRS